MNNNAQKYKKILMNIISRQKDNLAGFVHDPNTDFSRERKLPYEKPLLLLLTMKGTSLTNELLHHSGCDCATATSSAFVQRAGRFLRLL